MPRRFEYTDATSRKFWEITVKGTQVIVQYGRIGTSGRTQSKTYDASAEAKAAAEKQIAEKVKKGYVEVGGKKAGKAAPAKQGDRKPSATRKVGESLLIGQERFGGIVFFEDRTHYYVASRKEDERLDSRDNVHEAAGRRYGPKQPEYFEINGFRDWYLPTIHELTLMNTYINTKDLGNFVEDDRYWSDDDYEDEGGASGDAVPFQFDPPKDAVSYSMVEYQRDVKALERIVRDHDYPSYQGGGEYSGASELYVRLMRKQPKK